MVWVSPFKGWHVSPPFFQEAGLLASEVSGFSKVASSWEKFTRLCSELPWGGDHIPAFSFLRSPHYVGARHIHTRAENGPGKAESWAVGDGGAL